MATVIPPLPKTFIIRLDGSSGPGERAFLAIHYCVRCGHHWDDHGLAGAVPPSKSKCQLGGCACVRFMQDEAVE